MNGYFGLFASAFLAATIFPFASEAVLAGLIASGGYDIALLWAVVLGALLKFVLNEGLARWQLATGETILAGAVHRLGRPVSVIFILYLLPWSFFVGAALISACNCIRITPGLSSPTRIARQPSAGFGSSVGFM